MMTDRPIHNIPFTLLMTMLVVVAALMGTDLYIPSLPAVAKHFSTSIGIAQLTLTSFLISFSLTQIVYGPLSDKYGRRPILITGFSLYLFASLICLIAPNMTTLLIGRFIQGIGLASGAAMGRVLLRDLFEGKQLAKMMSYLAMGITLTPAVAPIIGGFIQQDFGFRANFLILLLFGALVLWMLIRHFPETNLSLNKYALHKKHLYPNVKRLFKSRLFLGNTLCSGIAFSTIIAYSAINPFLLENTLGVSPFLFGMLIFLIASGLIIGIFINSQLLKWIDTRVLQIIGFGIILMSSISLLAFHIYGNITVPVIVITNFFAASGSGFVVPNASASVLQPFPKIAGLAGSIYGCLQMLIITLVSAIIAVLHFHSTLNLSIIFLTIAILGIFFHIVFLNPFSCFYNLKKNRALI